MGFVSFAETLPRRNTFTREQADPAVSVGTYPNKSARSKIATVFALNTSLMKKLRWMIGDKTDVLFDYSTGEVQITRVPNDGDGWTICGGEKGQVKGGHIRLTVQPGVPFMVNHNGRAKDLVIGGDYIQFRLPEGWRVYK